MRGGRDARCCPGPVRVSARGPGLRVRAEPETTLNTIIDLRSDTLTQPTAAMRDAMAQAPVGDDVWGEDPTVARLQERAANLLGKPAALFVPSGTMANQIALLSHCNRADEVFVGEGNHSLYYESGAGQAWAGVSFTSGSRSRNASNPKMSPSIEMSPAT